MSNVDCRIRTSRIDIRHFLCLAVLLALQCSWDAPRDNPLDPYLGGNIEGRILTRRATGICDAEVLVPAASRIVRTDSAGQFGFYALPEESLWVYFAADGYVAESTGIRLEKGRIDTLTQYLNGLPCLDDCRVTSHRYGRNWPPDPLCFCRLSVLAGDLDGEADVESVWVEIPDIGYAHRLTYDPDEQSFVHTIRADSLPDRSLEALVGRDITFRVADRESATVESPACHLSRIIQHLPVPVFPAGGVDTLSTDTTFVWHRFNHGFRVRYHNEVVRIEGGGPAGVAAEFETAGPADTTFRFDIALLQPGDYYWTVEAIDTLGNSVRSREERFHRN